MSKKQVTVARPFRTDYAGAWPGHSKTREGAIIAAMRHLVRDHYRVAVITNLDTGVIVAELRMDDNRKGIVVLTKTQFKKVA